tara:strand:+ start:1407 stop:1601 length:195 start_codon:yes stop_codon:yes gene_type:complete
MNKVYVSIVILMLVMFWAILNPVSKEYWNNVGPSWKAMWSPEPVLAPETLLIFPPEHVDILPLK